MTRSQILENFNHDKVTHSTKSKSIGRKISRSWGL